MQWKNIKVVISALLLAAAFVAVKPSFAYAPNVTGSVTQNTGAPLQDVWVVWDSYELGDDGNNVNQGNHYRYAGSDSKGKYTFKSWDSEGVEKKGGQVYSNVGKKEYEKKINLDYDESNGDESRLADTNLYDIFNCHNEVNSFSLKLPPSLTGAKVQARWRRDSNNTAWSQWADNKVVLPKDDFTNSHDYQVEFRIELPKKASIRDLDKNIETSQLQSLNTKVPTCLKVDLCTEKESQCSAPAKTSNGVHRVVLSGVGEIQRKLTIGNESQPIWIVECIQRGTAENPQYMCTTGNTQLDNEVFKKDNFSALKNELGYSSRIFYSDGKTVTTPKITNTNRQDVYEWETKINPNKKLVSVFMAMYEPKNTKPPQSGDQPSQIQATLSNEEGCRLIVDPFGKVFDNYTMEPLGNTQVTLNKKQADGTYKQVEQGDVIAPISNPYMTTADGRYTFLVPPGTYQLNANKNGYSFTGNASEKALQTYANIYTGNDIVQGDTPQRFDIAMNPVDKNKAVAFAKSNPIFFETYLQSLDKTNNALKIQGIVSHSQATINVYSQKLEKDLYVKGVLLNTVTADKDGQFIISVPFSKLGKNEIIGELEAVKKDYPGIKKSVSLEPLLASVEGFATNDQGIPLSNATVGIYLSNSDVPVAETIADGRGYFSFATSQLPSLPYSIKTNETNALTARNFLTMNAKLGGSNNMYASAGSANEDVLGESVPKAYQPTSLVEQKSGKFSMVAIVLFIFIFTATALLAVYVQQHGSHKKRRRHL